VQEAMFSAARGGGQCASHALGSMLASSCRSSALTVPRASPVIGQLCRSIQSFGVSGTSHYARRTCMEVRFASSPSAAAPGIPHSATLRCKPFSIWSQLHVRTNGLPSSGQLFPQTSGQSTVQLPSAITVQVRAAGRMGGFKRKRKNSRMKTVHQKGLGKRMEWFWPKGTYRTRVPCFENSRRHVIYDSCRKRWLVMWYRHGIQVFKAFKGKGRLFEQGRARAVLFYKLLKNVGKLGRPKPDQCRSGVRGVYFDKEEKAWVARWSDCGMKKYAVYDTQEVGFQHAYREAVRVRIQSVRQNHQFVFQRTRWRGYRHPLGTSTT